jgi:hypothetical protein
LSFARTRQLTAAELGELADKLAVAEDPAEIMRLKSAMTRGFYGECHAKNPPQKFAAVIVRAFA